MNSLLVADDMYQFQVLTREQQSIEIFPVNFTLAVVPQSVHQCRDDSPLLLDPKGFNQVC